MVAVSDSTLCKCPRCFKVSPGKATFCPRCGVRLRLPQTPPAPLRPQPQMRQLVVPPPPRQFAVPPRRSSARPVLAVVGVLILFGVAASAFFSPGPVSTSTPQIQIDGPNVVQIDPPRNNENLTPYPKYPEHPSLYPYPDHSHDRDRDSDRDRR